MRGLTFPLMKLAIRPYGLFLVVAIARKLRGLAVAQSTFAATLERMGRTFMRTTGERRAQREHPA